MLPADIHHAIESLFDGRKVKDLSASALQVSKKYRDRAAEKTQQDFAISDDNEALAYVATRLPATYAASSYVLNQLAKTYSHFRPEAVLDVGAGPGTACLAAGHCWDTIGRIDALEPNEYLTSLGQYLTTSLPVHWVRGNIQTYNVGGAVHDLVMASYVFNEITERQHLYATLWDSTRDVLVLIEPGTPAGYQVIMEARDFIIQQGGHILAPCLHALACPLQQQVDRWCHFNVRVERSRWHRQIKADAVLGYEDEKFCYLIASKNQAVSKKGARLIGHPHGQKVVSLELCGADGIARVESFSKRDAVYKEARRAVWGALFNSDDAE